MNILLTGANGLIGSSLGLMLINRGHRVLPLTRDTGQAPVSQATWNPAASTIDLSQAGRLDAVVHLAGESIAQRWTKAARNRIRASRIEGTRLLSEAISRLAQPPRVLISASAIGYYGDRGAEWLDEQSNPGTGFLAQTTQEWEAATAPASNCGIRVVCLRFGIVLSPRGGALAKMLPVFRLGLGGPLGNGRQYWSWIALEDVLQIVQHALFVESLSGPVNVVAPGTVTNREFTRTLGAVLRRPAFWPVPAFLLRLLFGQMGRETLLASARVRPGRLLTAGYEFAYPELASTLQDMLHRV
jgi:hypothetical protein